MRAVPPARFSFALLVIVGCGVATPIRDAGVDGFVPGDVGTDGDTSEPSDGGGDTSDSGPTDAGATDGAIVDTGTNCTGVLVGDVCVDLDCDDLAGEYVSVADAPAPPYGGTVWFSAELIRADDPTSFRELSYSGQESRSMFDRRTGSFDTHDAHLFDARFGTTVTIEVQVNPEFSREQAEVEARRYAEVIGRLPAFIFRDLRTVWIHEGDNDLGGGNDNLLIHTGRGATHIADETIEEVLLHEGGHTSLDPNYAGDPLWAMAQAADGTAISDYARDFPGREDLSETIGPYLAYRLRSDRITPELANSVIDTIPNRVRYLDCLGFSFALVP